MATSTTTRVQQQSMLGKRQSSHSIRNGDGVHGRNQSHREEHRKQGNEQLYMQDNGQDIIKPRFEECVCVCVRSGGGCASVC